MSNFRGPRWSPPPPEASIHASVNISDTKPFAAPSNPTAAANASGTTTEYIPPQEEDTKSDTSFDPLFDDEPDADGEPDNDDGFNTAPSHQLQSQQNSVPYGQSGTLAMPAYGSYQNGGTTPAPAPAPVSQQQPRSVSASMFSAPKNAPPILDPVTYSMFSPDILMTASVDGQIILWDQRVHSPGQGVGRLWATEKTPPWCVSVSPFS